MSGLGDDRARRGNWRCGLSFWGLMLVPIFIAPLSATLVLRWTGVSERERARGLAVQPTISSLTIWIDGQKPVVFTVPDETNGIAPSVTRFWNTLRGNPWVCEQTATGLRVTSYHLDKYGHER